MGRRGTGRCAVALLVTALAVWGTGTAHASNEWPNEDMSGFADPYSYDMAYKPGTDVIGCATFKLQGARHVLGYWEYDTSAETWSGANLLTPMARVDKVDYPVGVAIDYVDVDRVVIAYSFKCNDSLEGVFGELGVLEGTYVTGSGWTWVHYASVDYEPCHGWQYEYGGPTVIAYHGFGSLDVACDQRTGHVGEYHVLYTAADWQYYSEQMYLDGIHADYYSAIFAKHGVHGSGCVPAPAYPYREILDEVGPAPYIGPGTSIFRCSVKAGSVTPPQVVFDDCRLAADDAVVCHSTWSDAGQVWGVESAFAWGELPSLALDPGTGNPRVVLNLSDIGLYYTASEDAGDTWSWYQVVDEDGYQGTLDIRDTTLGVPVMKVVYGRSSTTAVSKYTAGAWALVDTVSAEYDFKQKILVNPGSATDPWVMCEFSSGLGLGWNGPSQGCGAPPAQRDMSGTDSAWKALLPLGVALLALGAWRFRPGRSRKADA